MKNSKTPLGFVLLPGAGLGGWIWEQVAAKLARPALLIDPPGRGAHAQLNPFTHSLDDYVRLAFADIHAFKPHDLILVGHSSGAVIALELAGLLPERVKGFVGISAVVPKEGGSYLSAFPLLPRMFLSLMVNVVGTKPPAAAIRNGLCTGLDAEVCNAVVTRFVPESKAYYMDAMQHSAVPPHPLYIHLKNDKQIKSSLQKRMAAHLPGVKANYLATGHLPMLARPDALARLLNAYASDL